MGEPIRVAVVDEYPAQVRGVAEAVADVDGFEVVLRANSGADAREAIVAADDVPDVLVVEPWMRSGDGLELIQFVSTEYPHVAIIAFSRMWDAGHVEEAAAAGARAHLPKDTPPEDLPALIRHVRTGAEVRPVAPEARDGRPALTAREREVMRLVASGKTNHEIAGELFVTDETVKFHVRNIFRKLGVDNRTQAAYQAARLGIIG